MGRQFANEELSIYGTIPNIASEVIIIKFTPEYIGGLKRRCNPGLVGRKLWLIYSIVLLPIVTHFAELQ